MTLSTTDLAVLGVSLTVGGIYLFRGALSGSSSPKPGTITPKANGTAHFGNPRDFIEKMKASVRQP